MKKDKVKKGTKKEAKKGEHLPVYGVGPVCVYLMVGVLALLIFLRYKGYFHSGNVESLAGIFIVIGCVLIVFGIYMWIKAVVIGKIGDHILENHLCTTGVYQWVRNPIYSAIAISLIGISLLFHNLWFLLFPVFCWGDITILMINTEEKWLRGMYGAEYEEYCKKVNRCIPWFPKK